MMSVFLHNYVVIVAARIFRHISFIGVDDQHESKQFVFLCCIFYSIMRKVFVCVIGLRFGWLYLQKKSLNILLSRLKHFTCFPNACR